MSADKVGDKVRRNGGGIEVAGIGAVTPAGWEVKALRDAMFQQPMLPHSALTRPGWKRPMRTRPVPAPQGPSAHVGHPRLRRASSITRFAMAAAMEALGDEYTGQSRLKSNIGLILCVMTGCVSYSRRFYDETLRDPATASPLLFPETVFNAPSSHLAAVLGLSGINYTLVGDPGAFLQGLALGAEWLLAGRVEGCLVVGAEELDWIVADSFRLFSRSMVLTEGAGAVFLRRAGTGKSQVRLRCISSPQLYLEKQSRQQAARRMSAELPNGGAQDLLCDGLQGLHRLDAAEEDAWCRWSGARLSVKRIFGEGLTAAAAWQCVTAIDALGRGRYRGASVSVVGCNQQAIGAHFVREVG